MHRLTRSVLSSAAAAGVAVSMALGMGTATAHADILDDLANEYSLGAGAGQVSNLLKTSLDLRAQGFAPRRTQYTAIQNSLSQRPNQMPLIEALQSAVTYQSTARAQAAGGQSGTSTTVGVNQCDFNNQWNPQMGAIDWPPNSDTCNGPFQGGPGVVIGGGQTITNGSNAGDGYKIGSGR